MIELNQLRIGNLVKEYDEVKKVNAIKPHGVDFEEGNFGVCPPQDMNPIPLTEAVLRAAGFELFPEGYYFNFGCVVYKAFIRDGSGRWDGFTCNHSLRPLKGLHDLQNVFYFLRGKELDINMEKLKKAVG